MLLSPIASTVVAMLLLVLALALSLHYVCGGLHTHGPILDPESWDPSTGHLVMTTVMGSSIDGLHLRTAAPPPVLRVLWES